MNKQDDLIWMITFDDSEGSLTWAEKARFHSAYHSDPLLPAPIENQAMVTEFFERLNGSLQEMIQAYLEAFKGEDKIPPQAEELRQKLDTLNLWIDWIRLWLKNHPKH